MRELRPLPVGVEPHPSETGLGFLLRLARQNGMSLPALLRWVEVRSAVDISFEGVRALAFVSDVSPAWLAARLVRRGRVEGRLHRGWMGHAWWSPWTLRRCRPQVCAACLQANGICESAWEVTGVFLCLRHQQLLTDRCGHCRQTLSWSRPDVDVCSCGHYLSGPPDGGAHPRHVTEWIQLILARLAGEVPPLPSRSDWPPWVVNLSPEGMTVLIHALGVISKPRDRVGADASRSVPASSWMADVVVRGLARLANLTVIDRHSADGLKDVIYEQGLERLAHHGATQADRDIGGHLFDLLCRAPKSGLGMSGRKVRRQLDLFGEAT